MKTKENGIELQSLFEERFFFFFLELEGFNKVKCFGEKSILFCLLSFI